MAGAVALWGVGTSGLLAGCMRTETFDVIVIGGGGAGLAAAVSAAESGASTLLLEKTASLGGNTALSTGMYAAVDPVRQSKLGISDSIEKYFEQMMESGRGLNDATLVRVLSEEAYPTLLWLERHGMRFQDELIETYGSHWIRDHRPLMPNGLGYIRALLTSAKLLEVVIRTNAKAVVLRCGSDGNRINEVLVQTPEGEAVVRARKGIVVASGGFGANPDMVAEAVPELRGLTNDNHPGLTGEMIRAAHDIGARLRDMDQIQCLPGCPPGRTHRVRIHVDVLRFIMVNHEGRRFVREDGRRDDLRDAVLGLPQKYAFSLIDMNGMESHDILVQKATVMGVETGDAWRADSLEELALRIGVPAGNLVATVNEFNEAVRTKRDPLGRNSMNLKYRIERPPFWACLAGMTVHCTMGGIAIDTQARVLDEAGFPIAGLYAAGETTGGVHGANRLGAHGLPDAFTFGRIAGRNASAGV